MNPVARSLFSFCLALGLLLGAFSAQAQNDTADNPTNAVLEAAATIVSNALAQLSELSMTNEVGSNGLAQAEEASAGTNAIGDTNFASSPQLGPRESRRQWLLRQRAGAPGTNEPGNPNDIDQTNATAYSAFRPAKPEFSAFKLITDRNIFDPNRVPHRPGGLQPAPKTVESFALVGVMSYEKGTFAFFDGTSSDYRKAVKVADTIAGYKVTNIDANTIKLLAGTNLVELRVGMQLRREEGGGWVPSSQSESYAANSTPSAAAHADPPASGADNDVLERLHKKREQE